MKGSFLVVGEIFSTDNQWSDTGKFKFEVNLQRNQINRTPNKNKLNNCYQFIFSQFLKHARDQGYHNQLI